MTSSRKQIAHSNLVSSLTVCPAAVLCFYNQIGHILPLTITFLWGMLRLTAQPKWLPPLLFSSYRWQQFLLPLMTSLLCRQRLLHQRRTPGVYGWTTGADRPCHVVLSNFLPHSQDHVSKGGMVALVNRYLCTVGFLLCLQNISQVVGLCMTNNVEPNSENNIY